MQSAPQFWKVTTFNRHGNVRSLRAYSAAKDFLDLTSFTSCGVKKMTSLVMPPLFGL